MNETQQHIREIEEQGCTVVPGVFSPAEVGRLKGAVQEVLASEAARRNVEEKDVQFAFNLTNKHPLFREAIQTPILIAIMEVLLGPDCILGSLNARTSFPGAAPQGLHRDLDFQVHLPLPTYCNSVWMLDDFTAENGATRFVPGSHRRPDWPPRGQDDPPDTRAVTGRAGSLMIFDARLWHGGGANRSPRPRHAMHGFFCRSWMKPQHDHTRSIDPAVVAAASPLLLRLWGFKNQIPFEAAPGVLKVVPAPGISELA
jgi:ectoine hydroxylase-related dioxygenase (phytanoyl-CoA dioxygenase family)